MPAPLLHLSAQEPFRVPALDPAQEQVVAWRGPGTCLVLGGPGTGATTALIEAVAAELARAPEVSSSRMLVLARDRDAS